MKVRNKTERRARGKENKEGGERGGRKKGTGSESRPTQSSFKAVVFYALNPRLALRLFQGNHNAASPAGLEPRGLRWQPGDGWGQMASKALPHFNLLHYNLFTFTLLIAFT